jgi:cyclase
MLKKRIIPRILVNHSRSTISSEPTSFACITKKFSRIFVTGDPLSQALIFDSNLADEIAVIGLNIASEIDWKIFKTTLAAITSKVSTPLVAGGGINSLRQAQEIVELGVEKLCISYKTDFKYINLISSIADRYGSQAIQISIDYLVENGNYDLRNNLGNSINHRLESLLRDLQNAGMGEIVFTSVDCDGGKSGIDLSLFELSREYLSVPILLAGGASSPEDFGDALSRGADGVISGTYFAKKDQNPMQLKGRLATLGIPVRN